LAYTVPGEDAAWIRNLEKTGCRVEVRKDVDQWTVGEGRAAAEACRHIWYVGRTVGWRGKWKMEKGRPERVEQLLWEEWMLRKEKMVQDNCYRWRGGR
jgi:hypothetical protein